MMMCFFFLAYRYFVIRIKSFNTKWERTIKTVTPFTSWEGISLTKMTGPEVSQNYKSLIVLLSFCLTTRHFVYLTKVKVKVHYYILQFACCYLPDTTKIQYYYTIIQHTTIPFTCYIILQCYHNFIIFMITFSPIKIFEHATGNTYLL